MNEFSQNPRKSPHKYDEVHENMVLVSLKHVVKLRKSNRNILNQEEASKNQYGILF